MKKIIKLIEILFLISFLFFYKLTIGQTDTEFWFAVPSVTNQHVPNYPVHLVIASFDQSSRVTVSVPANSLVKDTVFTVAANSVKVLDLTSIKPNIEDLIPDSILNKGIHITGSNPITAYYDLGPNTNNREIFALKGANALGKEFYIPSQTLWANGNAYSDAFSGFDIVASEDSTIIFITPTSDCINQAKTIIHKAGITFKKILNKGQTYNMRTASQAAGLHLGGTHITSNKPIAITVKDDSIEISGCKDVIGDQIVPVNTIGNEYIIVRGAMTTANAESIFICTTQDTTKITINSTVVATLNKGQIFQYTLTGAAGANFYLTSSKPVYVYQVTGETGCESGSALLPSIRCTGSRDVAFSRSSPENFEIILITKKEYKGGFVLNINGVSNRIDSTIFIAVPGATDFVSARILYTTAQIPVNTGCIITNTKGLFHMGLNNGGPSSGGEYGYFSDFAKDTVFIKNTHYSGCKITLDAGPGKLTYKWFAKPFYKQFNQFDTLQTYIVKNPDTTKATTDTITVRTTTNGCTTSENMIVDFVFPKEITPFKLCHGQNATVSVPLDKYYTKFIWWDGDSINKTKVVDTSARYSLKLYDGSCPPAISYYDVVITPLPFAKPKDTSVCTGFTSLNLSADKQPGVQYSWSTGDTTRVITILETPVTTVVTNSYTVTVSNFCFPAQTASAIYTVKINTSDTTRSNVTHYSGCEIQLDAGAGYDKYTWNAYPPYKTLNPINTLQAYKIKNDTTNPNFIDTVWVTKEKAGSCKKIQQTIVKFVFPDSSSTIQLCQGKSAILKFPFNAYYTNFIWKDGNTTNTTQTANSTGKNWVKLYDGNCPPAITRYNVIVSTTPVVNLGLDKHLCLGDGDITLDAGIQKGNTISWYKNNILLPDTLRTFTVKDLGESSTTADSAHYKVVVANECKKSANSEIFIIYDLCEITIPNVFTPNNDGWNDKFIIKNVQNLSWEVLIYNRWGKKVFDQKKYTDDNAWTGSGCSEGVYYYVVRYKDIVKTGYVQLIR